MSIFKSLFRPKQRQTPFDLSSLGADMHSHLIPGIDDGAPTMDHSIAMLNKFAQLGYRKVITTPHILGEVHPNTPEIILKGLAEVQAEIKRLDIPIELEAAAEYYCDETLLPKIKAKELLSFGDNLVLMEYSMISPSQYEAQALFELQVAGYTPVLAHFERYPYYHGNFEKVEQLRERGILIQVNLLSLTGRYGPGVKKMAEELIEKGLVDFLGTDCHRIEHLLIIEQILDKPIFTAIEKLKLRNPSL
jgi:tyrosine-protein phosphatase YwqE